MAMGFLLIQKTPKSTDENYEGWRE